MKKCVDEDSKLYRKVSASRGRWKPGASKVYPKITSEQQLLKGVWPPSRYWRISTVNGKAYDSMFRWFI